MKLPKSTFIYKSNCTIKGLELDVVPEEKLHGLDMLFPDKVSLLSLNQKPIQLNALAALSLSGWNAEVSPRQAPAGSRDIPGLFQNPDPGILKNLIPGFFGIFRSP